MSTTLTESQARERAGTLLARARELFEKTHWAQRTFYKNEEKARFCSVGGIRYFYVGDPLAGILEAQIDDDVASDLANQLGSDNQEPWEDVSWDYEFAVRALAAAVYGPVEVEEIYELDDVEDRIYDWNDADDRQLPEVLGAFRTAEGLVREVALP